MTYNGVNSTVDPSEFVTGDVASGSQAVQFWFETVKGGDLELICADNLDEDYAPNVVSWQTLCAKSTSNAVVGLDYTLSFTAKIFKELGMYNLIKDITGAKDFNNRNFVVINTLEDSQIEGVGTLTALSKTQVSDDIISADCELKLFDGVLNKTSPITFTPPVVTP